MSRTRKPKKTITIQSRNMVLLEILHRQISEFQTIIKVHGDKPQFPDPYLHLSLVRGQDGWIPHLTDEKELDPARRHRPMTPVSNEESVRLFLLLFSAPSSPPPAVSSIENREEMDRAWQWVKERAAKAIHPPKHRVIRVFKPGPVRDVVIGLLNGNPDAIRIDWEEAVKLKDVDMDDPVNFEQRFQDDYEPIGLELAFMKHPRRAVFLFPGKDVIELRLDTVWSWIRQLQELPGIPELLKELERKGIIKSET
jgi:hypothetical protein